MFERVRSFFNRPVTDAEARTNVTTVQAFLRGFDLPGAGGTSDPYSHITVFRAINIIGNSLASVEYKLTKGKTAIESGPMYDLQQNPNFLMDWTEFIHTNNVNLHVSGNAFVYIDESDSKGIPIALLPLPSSMVKPWRGKDLYDLKGWDIKVSQTKTVRIPVESMIHIKYASNPNDPIMGMSPVTVAGPAIESDNDAEKYNNSMLGSGGVPPGILMYKGPGKFDEEMKEEIRQSWARTYGGPKNSSRIAVINQEWAWQNTGAVSVQDMALLETRKWNLLQICRALNVPPMYLFEESGTNQTESGKKVTRRLFMEETIIPIGRKFEGAMDKFYARYAPGLRGKYLFHKSEAMRDDLQMKATILLDMVKAGVSLNDAIVFLELDVNRQAWGDEWFIPMNMTTAQDVVDGTVKVPERPAGESGGSVGQGSDQLQIEGAVDNGSGSSAPKKKAASLEGRWELEAEAVERVIEKYQGRLGKVVMVFRSNVLGALKDSDPDALGEQISPENLGETVMPALIESYLAGTGESQIAREQLLHAAALFADSRYGSIVEFGNYLRSIVPMVVKQARLDPSDDLRDVKDVRQLFNRLSRRVSIVIRSNAFLANNVARYRALNGTFVNLQWLCSPGHECEHSELNEEIVPVGTVFSNGQKYPGESGSDANCDCIIIRFDGKALETPRLSYSPN